MELKAGTKCKSTVCSTEVIVVKAPGVALDLTCGGAPMVVAAEAGEPEGAPAEGLDGGTQMGKRYVDADETLEVLCTKPGAGTLGIGSTALALKEAKALPASD